MTAGPGGKGVGGEDRATLMACVTVRCSVQRFNGSGAASPHASALLLLQLLWCGRFGCSAIIRGWPGLCKQ
eukprot:2759542-Rhodomonas_salina.1